MQSKKRNLKPIAEASRILCEQWNGGYSVSIIRDKYIDKGIWKSGVHYVQTNPGGQRRRISIDVDAVNKFIADYNQNRCQAS